MRPLLSAAAAILALSLAAGASAAPAAPPARFDSATISGLGARNIRSAVMSDRISALAARAEPSGKTTLLVGAASGGIWKSTDGGTNFRPIFDRDSTQSFGALAIDLNHSDTYWAGTGESWMRNSVSIGDGVYKSTDGGETRANMGLPTSERISKVIVDPSDSATVYVCVPGRLCSDIRIAALAEEADAGPGGAVALSELAGWRFQLHPTSTRAARAGEDRE